MKCLNYDNNALIEVVELMCYLSLHLFCLCVAYIVFSKIGVLFHFQVPVPALKEQIASVTGVVTEQQRLICRGQVMKDDQLLSAYRILLFFSNPWFRFSCLFVSVV